MSCVDAATRGFAPWAGACCDKCGLPALLHGAHCEPEKGSRWVDRFGDVWTCKDVALDIVHLMRSYHCDGEPGFCGPYDVVESCPTPLGLFGKLYRPAADSGDDDECQLCEQERDLEPGTFTPHEHGRGR